MPFNPSPDIERHAVRAGNFLTRVVRRIEGFWQRVTDGIAIQELWSQFRSEARASYSLYTREIDWEALRKETQAGDSEKPPARFFGPC